MVEKLYNNQTELTNNEYLLKIRANDQVGFLAKLNQGNKQPPKKFLEWGATYNRETREYVKSETIYITEQNLCKGWEITGYRRGESQDWIKIKHPDGYHLEVKTFDFMKLISSISIVKGKITQALRWDNGELKLK